MLGITGFVVVAAAAACFVLLTASPISMATLLAKGHRDFPLNFHFSHFGDNCLFLGTMAAPMPKCVCALELLFKVKASQGNLANFVILSTVSM